MKKDVIIALDFKDGKTALEFLDNFKEEKPFVKIGMQLFYQEGPEIVRQVKQKGHKVFLDLKLHDIPNTVKGGMRSLANLGADILNLHAGGGISMMKAALEDLKDLKERPLVIAVTQLTSTSQEVMEKELWIQKDINDTVIHYAKNAKIAGLDGVVCSPLEAGIVKENCGTEFLAVTPGIRFSDGEVGDQVRVTTPKMAKEIGSDFIVVGRPITQAQDPVLAYRRCVSEFLG